MTPDDRQAPDDEGFTAEQLAELRKDYADWLAKRNVPRQALEALIAKWRERYRNGGSWGYDQCADELAEAIGHPQKDSQ